MEQSQWQPKRRIESEYQRSIQKLIDMFTDKLLDLGMNPFEVLSEFRNYVNSEAFEKYVRTAAARMVTGIAVQNARTWRQAAAEGMKSHMIHRALQTELHGPVGQRMRRLVEENSALITSLPDDIAGSVNLFIASQAMHGVRATEIAKQISQRNDIVAFRNRFSHLTTSRIALIARTETSKASTALTQSRSEELELPAYIWRTSRDGRVRPSHRLMDRVIVFWNDAPAPEALDDIPSTLGHYHAGNCPNCRCYAQPVINLKYVSWPSRVYRNDDIQYMTRSEFANLLPQRMLAA